ncbi:MAG: glycosyltransferase [Alphaproteobacteria bacterium]|nr:glycosyltransferase [Alphaproteobacteria bacterium]
MRARCHVVLFARAPRLGRVKRRLARDIGVVAAWRFYRFTLARQARTLARDRRWRLVLALDAPLRGRSRWIRGVPVMAQPSGDLGARMAAALDALPPGAAVLVGSDLPDLRPRHVAAAFVALHRADMVLGPASDGGYWLIGRRHAVRPLPRLEGVRWSTRHALADTRAALARRGTVGLAPTLADVDTGAAWHAWRRRSIPGTLAP